MRLIRALALLLAASGSLAADEQIDQERLRKQTELNSLHEMRIELIEQLASVDSLISALEADLKRFELADGRSGYVVTSVHGPLLARERPSLDSRVLFTIASGEPFEVTEPLSDEWWPVARDGRHAYARIDQGLVNSALFDLMRSKVAKQRVQEEEAAAAERAQQKEAREAAARAARAKKEAKVELESAERRARLVERWGEATGGRLSDWELWIGMSKQMVHDSWGTPHDISHSVSAGGVRDQWVYRSSGVTYYFHFDDGVLASWRKDL